MLKIRGVLNGFSLFFLFLLFRKEDLQRDQQRIESSRKDPGMDPCTQEAERIMSSMPT
jgi:hypothetical protein